MSTIFRVTARRGDRVGPHRRIDHGISIDREYAIWLAARCATRLSAGHRDPEDFIAAVASVVDRSEGRGTPESVPYDYGTVTILVLTDERQEQLRQLAQGDHFLFADEDIEALDLGAEFDDHELQNVSEVMQAAENRLVQVAALLPDRTGAAVDQPMKPAPVFIVHEASGAAYWLDGGYLMACPLDRGGDLRMSEMVQVEHTDPEHEPAMHVVRQALSALGRPTPESNPDYVEVFAEGRVDWIGAAIYCDGVTYIPIFFADGQVGYAVNSSTGDRQEYLYFNPSSADETGEPNVFVYQGPVGSPDRDGAIHYYLVLEDRAEGSAPGTFPATALRQAAMRTVGEGRVPEGKLTELVRSFGDPDARDVADRS